jgi:pimeloyl-ACP methyl ester carboxylesterase
VATYHSSYSSMRTLTLNCAGLGVRRSELLVVGHSIGGAVGAIAASKLQAWLGILALLPMSSVPSY